MIVKSRKKWYHIYDKKRKVRIYMKAINKILFAGAVIAAAKGLDNRLEVTRYTIVSPKLPHAFSDYRICLLSDIHCDTTAGLSDAVRSESPDIICIPGDMTHDDVPYEPFMSLLHQLIKIAPVYMVSGNHDIWRGDYTEFVCKCKKAGAVFLQNESIFIEQGSEKIKISGLEDPFARVSSLTEKNLADSLTRLTRDNCFEILLFHRANLFEQLCGKDFDLILSGHMHGGQIRIPKLGGVAGPKSNLISHSGIIFPKYFGGLYEKDGTKMIVTRGVGNPTVIPRLFNRPEICTIVLKSEIN